MDIFPRYFCSIKAHAELTEMQIVEIWHRGLIASDPEENVILIEKEKVANDIFRKLGTISREILISRIVFGKTLQEIANDIGKSRERVRQHEKKALRVIDNALKQNSRFQDLLAN